MAIPEFLSSSYRYFYRTNVSDVSTIISDFESEVLANSPVWTKLGTGFYKSPVDSHGRWFDVTLTRITQYKLEMVLRDNNGNTICTRRINAPSANNWDVRIYTGSHHFVIDVLNISTAPEALYGGILDLSPESQTAHTKYIYGNGYRNTSDIASTYDILYAAMIDNTTPTIALRSVSYGTGSTAGGGAITITGYHLSRPREMFVTPTGGGNMRYAGRCYQTLLVPDDQIPGSIVTLPIDSSETGEFCVIGGIATSANARYRVAVRVG